MPDLHTVLLALTQSLVMALIFAICARVLLSFLVRDFRNPLSRFVYDITEPILAPVRRVFPAAMGLDFSPMVALIGLYLVWALVAKL